MKKTIAILGITALALAVSPSARAGVSVHIGARIGIPAPLYSPPVYAVPAPVVAMAPVAPMASAYGAPVYVQPAPAVVYAPPPPVYVQPAPVVIAPPVHYGRPSFHIGLGFGHHHHRHHHHHHHHGHGHWHR